MFLSLEERIGEVSKLACPARYLSTNQCGDPDFTDTARQVVIKQAQETLHPLSRTRVSAIKPWSKPGDLRVKVTRVRRYWCTREAAHKTTIQYEDD